MADTLQNKRTPRFRQDVSSPNPYRTSTDRKTRSKRLSRKLFCGVVAAAVAFIVSVFYIFPSICGSNKLTQLTLPNQGTQVEITIAEGSGAQAVASILKQAGLIADINEFVQTVKELKADSSLKSGAYTFTVGASIEDIITQLKAGPNSTSGKLAIPEGLTLVQTAAKVEKTLGISSESFITQAKASNYAETYRFLAEAADDSLEGFLCPKTYDFSGQANISADMVIRAMLDQYAKEMRSLDIDGALTGLKERYGLDLDAYKLLTLASIVEREAVTEAQRPKVASTFFNRLKQDMALQSDATMMYVTQGEVTAEDLKIKSPYNTYLNRGLTPTPICSPSLESIKATLEPADTTYLYFFITQTGEWFSSTYEEHLKAIEQNR